MAEAAAAAVLQAMERAGRITDSFPRRHRAQTRAGGKERSGARRRRGGEGRHRVVPPAPAPPTPPHPAQDDARDPSAPPREAPRELLEMLRRFDLAWEYGPCTGEPSHTDPQPTPQPIPAAHGRSPRRHHPAAALGAGAGAGTQPAGHDPRRPPGAPRRPCGHVQVRDGSGAGAGRSGAAG